MVIDMNEAKLTTLEQLRAFLAGTIEIEFSAAGRDDNRYRHIAEVLNRFGYKRLKKPDKGLILRYLGRTTDYSRQQLTRIVKRWRTGRKLAKAYPRLKHGLVHKFTDPDIALLAGTDSLHGGLSRPATGHCYGARGGGLRRYPLRAPGNHFGGAPLQPAQETRLLMPNSAVATPGQSTNTTLNFKREFSPLCSTTEISKWVNYRLLFRYQPKQ